MTGSLSLRRGRLPAVIVISAVLMAMFGARPADAETVTAGQPLGIVHQHKGTTIGAFLQQFPQPSLQYFGGPVLRTNQTFAIFWDPAASFAQSYRDLVIRYLRDIAADDGTTTNVYSVLNQYYDTTGPIGYASSFAGSAVDTDPYPTGCPSSLQYPVCFTDQQLANELDTFLFVNNIARPSNRAFLVFTPSGVNSCFNSSSFSCASNLFCAYHSGFTGGHGDAIYANLPYAANRGCDTGQHPNGSDADPVLNTISHEHKEMIDDPLGWKAFPFGASPTAWFDPARLAESDDQCAWYFGPTQTNGVGDYNQVINGHQYLLQTEWSNALAAPQALGCVANGADHAPTAAFTSTTHGAVVSFDASASSDPDPGDSISSYVWSFGDGTGAPSDATTNHSYPAAGTYKVVLYVTDMHAASASMQQFVTVGQPGPTIPFTAKMTEFIGDRGRILGAGTMTRLGRVQELALPRWIVFDFSQFPVSIGVSARLTVVDNTGSNGLNIHYHATLTDVDSPPQGNNYNLTGNWSIAQGFFVGANDVVNDTFGSGTITGTCNTSFTSDIATCADTWSGTIGPP